MAKKYVTGLDDDLIKHFQIGIPETLEEGFTDHYEAGEAVRLITAQININDLCCQIKTLERRLDCLESDKDIADLNKQAAKQESAFNSLSREEQRYIVDQHSTMNRWQEHQLKVELARRWRKECGH